jgi:uncharacterized membrane protein (Fun14 family)
MYRYLLLILFFCLSNDLASAQTLPAPDLAGQNAEVPLLPPDLRFALLTLGGGGIAGWAVGFTLKKFAKMAALIVGVAFISLQFLAFNQFITIDWNAIKNAVPDESLEKSATSIMAIVTYNLPFAGSFVVGFWLGFRKG